MLRVRKAEFRDLKDIVKIFKGAIKNMDKQGINQWDEVYPNEDVLKEDIMKKEMYLYCKENEILSVFVLNKDYDEAYNRADWKYPELSFAIVHRLCVNPSVQNRGIGTKTLNIIEELLNNKNIESIRLDVFSENPFALKMYEKHGYKKVGTANWRKGLFYLYEKKL